MEPLSLEQEIGVYVFLTIFGFVFVIAMVSCILKFLFPYDVVEEIKKARAREENAKIKKK